MNLFRPIIFPVLLIFFGFFSVQAFAYSEACQLVAQMAGNKEYQAKPMRLASMARPEAMDKKWGLLELERHGAWFIYKTPQAWINKEQCAPVNKAFDGKTIQFMPVLLNKLTGHNAVVTGTFILKVYRKQHWDRVMQRYALKMLSPLPSPKARIVDVKPTQSYDLLIREFDRDKDVIVAFPLLSEPRARR